MVKDYVINGSLNRPVRFKLFCPEVVDAVIIVVHGMQEHSGRYVQFAEAMNENRVAVITSDLRGHGQAIEKKAGLDEGNIFLNIVEDQKAIIQKAKELFLNKKIVVLGHSFGSFVAQRLIKDRVVADKFILSGSNFMKGLLYSLGGFVAKLTHLFKGRDADAKLVESLSIKGYGKKFENRNWLTRDENVWNSYLDDPMCGNCFPVSFYESMFNEIPKNYKNLKNSVGYAPKIMVLSGTDDPVGNYSKGVVRLAREYEDNGYDVTLRLYEGGRHEMLNEINKKEVYADILSFI